MSALRLRRAAAALALAAALPAAAYVLPVKGILRRLAERRAALSLDTLDVRGTLAARGEAGARLAAAAGLPAAAGEVSVPARLQLKVPARCRLELVSADPAEPSRPAAALRADGKLSGPLADVPAVAALLRGTCALLATSTVGDGAATYAGVLGRRGVALADATLGRFDGQLAFVVGGRDKEAKPLLYVQKDGFQPLRLVAPEGKDLLDVRLLGWGSPMGGDWFPRAVEVWAKDAEILRLSNEKTTANAKIPEPFP